MNNQKLGALGEQQAAAALRRVGVNMVEKIGTPVKLLPSKLQGAYRVIFGEKVSGDHRGVASGGISVLAETKTVLDGNLRWSHLRKHQPERLSEHEAHGGISLLVWVSSRGIFVMQWIDVTASGFKPRKSITAEQAEKIAIEKI